ncbi:DoxX family protein [Litoribacter populi]|uniref:DoxX family protein n=1 Tax=Litoribacter populi TaxID=2598460 RepID=UPI00117E3237|nr:DoxX family protein [Litoribacter populi]
MKPLPSFSQPKAVTVLRIVLGVIFISHGAARLYYGSVGDFGGFLNSQGLIVGDLIAWTVTIGEILSGSLLIYGLWVKYLSLFHALIIVAGIFLVHLPNGWFVVGHGQGGVEYSVLLLVSLLVVYSSQSAEH